MDQNKDIFSQDREKDISDTNNELPTSLEDLNAAFQARKKKKKKTFSIDFKKFAKPQQKKRILVTAVCLVLLIAVSVGAYNVFHKKPEAVQATLPKDILTEAELKKWEEDPVDDTQVFFELNTLWTLGSEEDEVFIRLLNPPYSAFPIKVQIYLEDKPGEILYESELLEPGTIIEKVPLEPRPEKGEYAVIVKYSFYEAGSTDKIFGMHEVSAELTVE